MVYTLRIHNCATCAYVLHDIVRPREPANASASCLHTNVPMENQWFFSRATSQTFPRTVYSAYTCCLRRPHVTQLHNTFEMDQVRFGPLAVPNRVPYLSFTSMFTVVPKWYEYKCPRLLDNLFFSTIILYVVMKSTYIMLDKESFFSVS